MSCNHWSVGKICKANSTILNSKKRFLGLFPYNKNVIAGSQGVVWDKFEDRHEIGVHWFSPFKFYSRLEHEQIHALSEIPVSVEILEKMTQAGGKVKKIADYIALAQGLAETLIVHDKTQNIGYG